MNSTINGKPGEEGTGLGEGRVIEVGEGSGLIDDGERGEFCDEMGLVNE